MDVPTTAGSQNRIFNESEPSVSNGEAKTTSYNNFESIVRIQAIGRGRIARQKFKEKIRKEVLTMFGDDNVNLRKKIPKNTNILKYGLVIIAVYKHVPVFGSDELEVMIPLFQSLVKSMESSSTAESFAALFLSVEYMQQATRLITSLCQRIPSDLAKVNLNRLIGVKFVDCAAKFLFTFHSCRVNNWAMVKNNASIMSILDTLCAKMSAPLAVEKNIIFIANLLSVGLKGRKPLITDEAISKLFLVVLRIMKNQKVFNCEPNCFARIIVLNYFTCPAIVRCFSEYSMALRIIKSDGLLNFQELILWLVQNHEQVSILSTVESLNLLANFIHISHLEQQVMVENLLDWAMVVNSFLIRCQQQLSPLNTASNFGKPQNNRSNNWHHPILGWISERIDEGTQGTFSRIREQLSYLWSAEMVHCLFGKVLASFQRSSNSNSKHQSKKKDPALQNSEVESLPNDLIQRLLKRLPNREQPEVQTQSKPLPPVSITAVVCQLYQNALLTFANTQIEILSGLCRNDAVLLQLWNFINEDRNGGLSNYLGFLTADPSVSQPHFAPLHLFADTAYSLISILDEREMYESSAPFKLDQLREIARFANVFCFKVIWDNLIDLNERRPNALFQSIYQLCTILYNRDCRRSFTNKCSNFWTISDVKPAQVINEFERQSPKALNLLSRLPHVVPLHDRMVLFRKLISKDKESSFHPTTVISVNRARIVEDGYRQLSNLSSQALRGTIRVKFINQQGLDEAGIDQDGVFKEFLELTLKKVYDPELNLFKSTSNNLLYPSSTSSIHENHLGLFQFVGRMLAKAVYEGICVDVQLAPVLLATVLTKQLCPFDELASLDPMLYKNEIADLELIFAYNEEFLGKVKTTELIVGGQDMKVCKENRILYIHKMAQFRVIKQTKEQTDNFVGGFRSVIGLKWLSLFNTHELQYLISGHTSDIDLEDLRKHAQYYGGFHNNHRLIKWLWSILQNDFTVDERHLFLKFVTSCSRAPLLGFAFLEPPFSIRCVETSDDMDQGDTLGSVIRGFLAIKRKQPMNRLPTASTCFNLLKLPNYKSRSVLLEKLRYAIHAETGFELS
ncbi:HECT-domain (ubiquitin-transferase) domain-containing protein [Ditylenchus destructor]|uniref:HECT-type E3 ubiquitin transferase n=1 Tax=Ditylenchus destructor TaxID=166010 RepID=A0AAD4R6W7_9BILA|nr:HECT-domain (ubiquitin-transferase) domain-containing protein [Ditylenchus destructor]